MKVPSRVPHSFLPIFSPEEPSNRSKQVEEFAKFEWWRVTTFSYDRSVSVFMSLRHIYVRNLSSICPHITKPIRKTSQYPGMMVSLLVFRKLVFFLPAHWKQGSRYLSEVQKSIFFPLENAYFEHLGKGSIPFDSWPISRKTQCMVLFVFPPTSALQKDAHTRWTKHTVNGRYSAQVGKFVFRMSYL